MKRTLTEGTTDHHLWNSYNNIQNSRIFICRRKGIKEKTVTRQQHTYLVQNQTTLKRQRSSSRSQNFFQDSFVASLSLLFYRPGYVRPLICIFVLFLTSPIAASMKHSSPASVTAWMTTSNQRLLLQKSSSWSSLRLVRQTRKDAMLKPKTSFVQREWTMITDSRELRFMEGCNSVMKSTGDGRCIAPTSSSPLWTNHENQEQSLRSSSIEEEASLALSSSTPSSTNCITTAAAYSKSTMSVVEDIIATSYYRALEHNHEIVSSVFRPLLDTIHSNPKYRSQQEEQQQQGGTAVMTAAEPSVSILGGGFRAPGDNVSSSQTNGGNRFFSSATRSDHFPTFTGKSMVGNFPKYNQQHYSQHTVPQRTGYGSSISLTDGERDLFQLLRRVRKETHLQTTLRVAGGWVRDKLLATPEFQTYHKVYSIGKESLSSNKKVSSSRITSRFHRHQAAPSMGRQGTKILTTTPRTGNSLSTDEAEFHPVDIDIALDDMLGREFADHLNQYLVMKGEESVSVGMVLKNPEKSKHLETATMKVNSFWIDFVNLRAEEYTQESRIPDLMRIGTAVEDAYRRDLTINSLFYNINTGEIEDWTGRGFDDLRKGVISTPLPPLTTLLDDPLRVLRSIRFAARLRFSMDNELIKAAKDERVANALSLKVSRERVGGELDLMLRSPDPVGAIRLLINLNLIDCVFPVAKYLPSHTNGANSMIVRDTFRRGLELLSTTHDHLADCKWSPPVWCSKQQQQQQQQSNAPDVDVKSSPPLVCFGAAETLLLDDEDARRLLWYASFIDPIYHEYQKICTTTNENQQIDNQAPSKRSQGKKSNRSIITKILVDELKRPNRDADSVERIIKTSDDFIQLINAGCDVSATMIILSEIRVVYVPEKETFECYMHGRKIDSINEEDPVWQHAMEFRLLCSKVMMRIGPLWRASLCLSIARELVRVLHGTDIKVDSNDTPSIQYAIEGDVINESQEECRQGIIERYDVFAAAMQQIGVIGIWNEKPIADGDLIRTKYLQAIPPGPAFRDVMEEQINWMTSHPGKDVDALMEHLKHTFPSYVATKTIPDKKK
jgi:tRNA nucleotidyltransferase/poly(A) polymerase